MAAQTVVPLFTFNKEWRYETSGYDLGTAWRTNDYDDSAWLAGPGLFQGGEATAYPVPFRTTLPAPNGVITYYFRTHLDLPSNPVPRSIYLRATNFVDDGCVIHLNGMEAGRIRMPDGPVNRATLANAGPAVEGQRDVLELKSDALRPGDNLVSVEVHQNSGSSADVVWGMSLTALIPDLLVITQQPRGVTNFIGESISLSVGVAGGPVHYQWRKGDVNIPDATNSNHVIPAANTGHSGEYTVLVTNSVTVLTSDVARVLIAPDLIGPIILSAIVQGAAVGQSNNIDLFFDEPLMAVSFGPTNFLVTRISTGHAVTVTNVLHNVSAVRLHVGGPEWVFLDDYLVTIVDVRDVRGNVIAPGTRVAVSWPIRTNVFGPDQQWSFHNSAIFDPTVYGEAWTARDYAEDSWWGWGRGVFHHMPESFVPCLGSLELDLGIQLEACLFRTTFVWPAERRTSRATLIGHYLIDDGAVFYLNGAEVHRYNQSEGPVTAQSRAIQAIATPSCVTNVQIVVSNLVAGTNWLAVAVTQADSNGGDVAFGLELDARYLVTPALPDAPPAELSVTPVGPTAFQLSWPVGGYALEASTNLSDSGSHPFGPWIEVTDMSNPYVILATNESQRFFRLKRKWSNNTGL